MDFICATFDYCESVTDALCMVVEVMITNMFNVLPVQE